MLKLSKKEVKKIAELSRLKIDDKNLEYYSLEISGILNYVEKINKLDTKGVEVVGNISGINSVFRLDKQYEGEAKQRTGLAKILVKLVPFSEGNFVKVKSVFGKKV